MKTNQKGFSVVEVLVVIIIVGLLGTVGWLVYDRQKNKTDDTNTASQTTQQKTTTTQTTATVDPYAGWKTTTLQYEKITYQYPSSWVVEDQTSQSFDDITLKSPAGATVSLQTGVSSGSPKKTFGSISVNSLAQSNDLVFQTSGQSGGTLPSEASFNVSAKNIPANPVKLGDVFTYSSSQPETVEAMKQDADFKTALLIFESMKY